MSNRTRDYNSVLKQLDEIHTAKSRKKHPLWLALMKGELSRPQVVVWLKQFSAIPLYNHFYHGPLYVNCPSPKWRARMAEVVYEEGTGKIYSKGIPHYQLYLRMAAAFGISSEEMYGTELCGGSLAVRNYLENVCRRSFLEGFAALSLGSEAQVPGLAKRVSEAMISQYGLTPEQAMFYTVHEEADSEHSGGSLEFLEEFAKTDEDINLVVRAVSDCVEASWCMFEDIWKLVQRVR